MNENSTVAVQNFYHHRLRVRVSGICVQQNQLLLVKHVGMSYPSSVFWSPPGGGLDYGEGVEKALQREFREECQVDIAVGRLLTTHEFLKKPLHAIELFFEVKILGGVPQLGYDPELSTQLLSEVAWLPFDKIKAMPPREVHQILGFCTNLDDIFNLPPFLSASLTEQPKNSQ
jgi:8-oxo-dGTP diphosphatase